MHALIVLYIVCILLNFGVGSGSACAQPVFNNDSIDAPLNDLSGDAARGRKIVLSRQAGLCILCHSGPFPEERFQGNLAPDLALSASKLSSGQIRARIVDARRFNPDSIMPSYFSTEHLARVAPQYEGKTILNAQEIEDVVAFLVSLK
ncbi:MAG TPA: sulfur oxidation c-type cytochrome SoxX [Alcaligenaceae bacterium]|nr:sulfur oxidation c-type cytochrome SoxX [Alcaligenaceae bacterium]